MGRRRTRRGPPSAARTARPGGGSGHRRAGRFVPRPEDRRATTIVGSKRTSGWNLPAASAMAPASIGLSGAVSTRPGGVGPNPRGGEPPGGSLSSGTDGSDQARATAPIAACQRTIRAAVRALPGDRTRWARPAIAPRHVSDHPRRPECPEKWQGPCRLIDQDREEVALVPGGDGLEERRHVGNQADLIDDHPPRPPRPPPGQRRLTDRLQPGIIQVRGSAGSLRRPAAIEPGPGPNVASGRFRPPSGTAPPGQVRQPAGPEAREGISDATVPAPNRIVRPIMPPTSIAARSNVGHPALEPRCLIETPDHGPAERVPRPRARRSRDLWTTARTGLTVPRPRPPGDIGWSQATINVILDGVYEPATSDLQAASPGRGIPSRGRNRRISPRVVPVAD